MQGTLDIFNSLLSSVFYDIMKLEETFLKNNKFKDISSKEVKIIEAIGDSRFKNMGTIAQKLEITLGTLTVSIKNLEKKGYVNRQKSLEDRRVVNIIFTEKGQNVFKLYKSFKDKIMKDVFLELSTQEKKIFNDILKRFKEIVSQFYINI